MDKRRVNMGIGCFSIVGRNIQTIIGEKVAGQGVGYYINIYGSQKLRRAPLIWGR